MIRMSEERSERGIALLTVLLVGFALSAIALASTMWILNAQLVQKSGERAAILNDVAVAAVEEGRSRIAATPALYPAFGHDTLDLWTTVTDANGATIPNVRRSIYVGPDGVTSGQYGVFGTIIAEVKDTFGNRVVRRLQINQESFAKYAYFTTIEGDIVFANNDQIWGPVHSNDQIEIHNSGATFHNTVSTAAATIAGEGNGTFNGGPPKKSVPAIPLPTTAAFNALQVRAANGNMSFAGNTLGNGSGEASIRMEFVALDLNADGDSTDVNEGFVRIYPVECPPVVRDRASARATWPERTGYPALAELRRPVRAERRYQVGPVDARRPNNILEQRPVAPVRFRTASIHVSRTGQTDPPVLATCSPHPTPSGAATSAAIRGCGRRAGRTSIPTPPATCCVERGGGTGRRRPRRSRLAVTRAGSAAPRDHRPAGHRRLHEPSGCRLPLADQPHLQPLLGGGHLRERPSRGERRDQRTRDTGDAGEHHHRRRHPVGG